jgi:hypothetical protein
MRKSNKLAKILLSLATALPQISCLSSKDSESDKNVETNISHLTNNNSWDHVSKKGRFYRGILSDRDNKKQCYYLTFDPDGSENFADEMYITAILDCRDIRSSTRDYTSKFEKWKSYGDINKDTRPSLKSEILDYLIRFGGADSGIRVFISPEASDLYHKSEGFRDFVNRNFNEYYPRTYLKENSEQSELHALGDFSALLPEIPSKLVIRLPVIEYDSKKK